MTAFSRLPISTALGLMAGAAATDRVRRGGVRCGGSDLRRGGDAREHFRDVFLLSWNGRTLKQSSLQPLPRACAFAGGALVGHIFYLVGGIEKPDSTTALSHALGDGRGNIAAAGASCLPVRSSANARCAVRGRRVFYFRRCRIERRRGRKSGARIIAGRVCVCARAWLEETRGSATRRHRAPSPAPLTGDGHLLVISGDDGRRGHLNGPDHPGFPTDILSYDPDVDLWTSLGDAPISRATAPTASWAVAASSSAASASGYRSPEVWLLDAGATPAP